MWEDNHKETPAIRHDNLNHPELASSKYIFMIDWTNNGAIIADVGR